ncbi:MULTISPECIES: hypothetical protein [Borreliella]|uniref:Uncharacterized protein n=1 Tax=Borrelia garinii subsp. bavariensis (strain ATCC BAA-2496 / DSM 23469 / PBi) TaxID=290434 RepID=A0ABN5RF98_BORGP|nr:MULTISPECIES: hypothetical protein [Borreliella]AZA27179.1 hypothetical protein DB299_04635 [Borreliella bavariensis PBi]WLN24506.1 hypothetical protein IDK87_04320 [Borreliella bavariensis]
MVKQNKKIVKTNIKIEKEELLKKLKDFASLPEKFETDNFCHDLLLLKYQNQILFDTDMFSHSTL